MFRIENVTNQEVVLMKRLFREAGQPDCYYDIPTIANASWANNDEVLQKLFSGDFILTYPGRSYSNVNEAVNALKGISNDIDPTGRPINRLAATIKGWHYQAHSIEFEVNKLNSIYNKDADGNDLGYGELKIYDNQNNECTTQLSADTNGVKTIITWKPDFDFEIISGNIRQATKETINSYVHVRLQSATGLPAPHDWFAVPFTQGGINLKYIGADEPLKTDGRASKLIKAGTNGDYFEIIVNYPENILTNENRHEMSIIFEIYKDPTS
jgi:hypothetical protein